MKDIFLCHTDADKEWVEKLAERLEAQAVGDRKLTVWFDKWDIDPGANILSKIEDGLKESRFVGVVLSPAMTNASWPALEWQTQVFEDPAGKRGRILPLLRHVFDPITHEAIEIPLPLKILKRFDFSLDRHFEEEFGALVRHLKGEPPVRGSAAFQVLTPPGMGAEEPDEVSDSLISNLLPVLELPTYIFSDESTESDPAVIIDRLHPKVPWLLSGGRLFSFCDPAATKSPFEPVLSGRFQKREKVSDWLSSDKKAKSVIRLLNDALRDYCRSRQISLLPGAKTKDQFFFAIRDGKSRSFRWSTTARPRTLAKIARTPSGEGFGVHHAASLRFLNLSGAVFLLVQPGWTFTSDGRSPLLGRQVGQLTMRWGGRERNSAVLRNTLMWGLALSGGKSEIPMNVGAGVIRVAAVPCHTILSVGVKGDSIMLARILGGEGGGETRDIDDLDSITALTTTSPSPDQVWDGDAMNADEEHP